MGDLVCEMVLSKVLIGLSTGGAGSGVALDGFGAKFVAFSVVFRGGVGEFGSEI